MASFDAPPITLAATDKPIPLIQSEAETTAEAALSDMVHKRAKMVTNLQSEFDYLLELLVPIVRS
jgi:hypothetical protein